jgi:hypothetical protein
MIESHYGHLNTFKHADRTLQGMAGWEVLRQEREDTKAKASRAVRTIIESALEKYVGSAQVRLIGDELWGSMAREKQFWPEPLQRRT